MWNLDLNDLTNPNPSYETNYQRVCNYYFDCSKNDQEVNIIPLGTEPRLYQIETVQKTLKDNHDIPIFNQIIENEWLAVYQLIEKVKNKPDFNLISIRTDEVIFQTSDNHIEEVEFNTEIGGYKKGKKRIVNKTPPEIENKCQDYNTLHEWNTIHERCSFENLVDILIDTNKSFLIDGLAGCGKTFFAKMLIQKLKEKCKKVEVLAPTNTAALNIGGQTIHKFLGIDFESKVCKKYIKKLMSYDYIIIDEISMVNSQVYISTASILYEKMS